MFVGESVQQVFTNAFVDPLIEAPHRASRNADFAQQAAIFNARIEAVRKRAPGNGLRFATKVTLDLISNIVNFQEGESNKYPVDTGRSRAGWMPILDEHAIPYKPRGTSPTAIAEGKACSTFDAHPSQDEPSITIANNVEYTIELEYGSSKQAPDGCVRKCMTQLAAEMEATF